MDIHRVRTTTFICDPRVGDIYEESNSQSADFSDGLKEKYGVSALVLLTVENMVRDKTLAHNYSQARDNARSRRNNDYFSMDAKEVEYTVVLPLICQLFFREYYHTMWDIHKNNGYIE